jgi:hypothetical protein
MTDKVLCPYCGSEMKHIRVPMTNKKYLAYMVCSNNACHSIGPTVTDYKTSAEAEAAALAAAQARYLPPNRPLTFDEVNALPADDDGYAPCFLEIEPNWYAQDTDDFDPRLRADAISTSSSLGVDTYGKNYRAWLRKPTQAEMDAAGWGGDATDD